MLADDDLDGQRVMKAKVRGSIADRTTRIELLLGKPGQQAVVKTFWLGWAGAKSVWTNSKGREEKRS
jgi:hypothetical protein